MESFLKGLVRRRKKIAAMSHRRYRRKDCHCHRLLLLWRDGYEAARQVLGLNISNVILAVRSMSKGGEAKNTLAAVNTVKLQTRMLTAEC